MLSMRMLARVIVIVSLLGFSLMAVSSAASVHAKALPVGIGTTPDGHPAVTPFTITSPDFEDGDFLPPQSEFGVDFGCNGKNIAPTLTWKNVPPQTLSFALLMNDPDAPVAGGFHHWVVYNIPANVTRLNGNSAFTNGANSVGTPGYFGPCPPADGQIHHYVFTLYALSVANIGAAGMTYEDVIQAIAPDVNGATVIVGKFRRFPPGH